MIRYGRYVGITEHKFAKVERFFLEHGEISTFVGRLFPVVRHLISIPAGLAGMNHLRFSAYTLAGAGIWVAILTAIGYMLGANQELIMRYSHQALGLVAVASAILVAGYVWRHRRAAAARLDDRGPRLVAGVRKPGSRRRADHEKVRGRTGTDGVPLLARAGCRRACAI